MRIAREEDTSISKIYSDELGDQRNRGYDSVTEIPGQQIVKRTLYNNRAKLQGNKMKQNHNTLIGRDLQDTV